MRGMLFLLLGLVVTLLVGFWWMDAGTISTAQEAAAGSAGTAASPDAFALNDGAALSVRDLWVITAAAWLAAIIARNPWLCVLHVMVFSIGGAVFLLTGLFGISVNLATSSLAGFPGAVLAIPGALMGMSCAIPLFRLAVHLIRRGEAT